MKKTTKTTKEGLRREIREAVRRVRMENPMAPSITNTVTINLVANAQLAVGGSAAMVYLADEGRLRLEADGAIRYLSADGKDLGGAESEEDRIELSRSLLARFADVCGGAGDLQYAASHAEENHVTYRFDYRVSGIRVKLTGGSAGWAVFRDGRLIELGFRPRTYQITEEMVHRIPPLQAAAASGRIQRGSAPELIISDPGGDVLLEPVWIMQEGRT